MGFGTFASSNNALLTERPVDCYLRRGTSWTAGFGTDNLGAQTTPNDMIQLHFTTPPIDVIRGVIHLQILVFAANAAVFKMIEAPTGGLASPDGTIEQFCLNRYAALAGISCDTPVSNVYYNGTEATGGTTLRYCNLGQENHPGAYDSIVERETWILAPETTYAFNVFKAAAIAASITLFGAICTKRFGN